MQDVPHLLVMGDGNSFDPGQALTCIRPSEGRNGGCGAIGEIALMPPPSVFSNTKPID
jgi:hypothetical protein